MGKRYWAASSAAPLPLRLARATTSTSDLAASTGRWALRAMSPSPSTARVMRCALIGHTPLLHAHVVSSSSLFFLTKERHLFQCSCMFSKKKLSLCREFSIANFSPSVDGGRERTTHVPKAQNVGSPVHLVQDKLCASQSSSVHAWGHPKMLSLMS